MLVGQAGSTMDEVVTSIKRVADIVGEIAQASIEQSAGVAQVNDAVTGMDHVTQQNAALVEQSWRSCRKAGASAGSAPGSVGRGVQGRAGKLRGRAGLSI